MQADRKKMAILIIVIALIAIILIIYFGFLRKKPAATINTTASSTTQNNTALPASSANGTTTPSDAPLNHKVYDISKEPVHKVNADDLGKIAMSFAERFGSFSNQSNYGNFTDLKILMTDSMKSWADKYVADLKSQPQNKNVYYGVVTTALTYSVKKYDDQSGKAEITIVTQRQESTEKINGGTPYRQNLTLSLAKVNGEWLFDKANWETK